MRNTLPIKRSLKPSPCRILLLCRATLFKMGGGGRWVLKGLLKSLLGQKMMNSCGSQSKIYNVTGGGASRLFLPCSPLGASRPFL